MPKYVSMAYMEPKNTPPANDTSAPVNTPPAGGVATPPNAPAEDITKIKVDYEVMKKENEALKAQWENAKPVLETVYGDPEALTAAQKAYNKRHGIVDTPPPASNNNPPADTKNPPAAPIVPVPSATEIDNRNTLVANTVRDFNREHGIDKLDPEAQKNLNIGIMNELREMLDPAGLGKNGAQLLDGVPLAKLPAILDRAYLLATRTEREKKIAEAAKNDTINDQAGLIGSIPSGDSGKAESITLTNEEKKAARKMHMSEDDYLKNKIEIAKREGSIY